MAGHNFFIQIPGNAIAIARLVVDICLVFDARAHPSGDGRIAFVLISAGGNAARPGLLRVSSPTAHRSRRRRTKIRNRHSPSGSTERRWRRGLRFPGRRRVEVEPVAAAYESWSGRGRRSLALPPRTADPGPAAERLTAMARSVSSPGHLDDS